MCPTAQRMAIFWVKAGISLRMYGSSWQSSTALNIGGGRPSICTVDSRPTPKLPCASSTTCPFCTARQNTWLTDLPSRSTSASKLTGTSTSMGPTKVIASERTGRPASATAAMAS